MVKIRGGRRSQHVEYRRGTSGGRSGLPFPIPGSRGGRVGAGAGGLGLLGILAVVVFSLLAGGGGGGGLGDLLDEMSTGADAGGLADGAAADPDEFLEVVFDDVQAFWDTRFPPGEYRFATLVIFPPGGVQTGGCGFATSAVGPFYCPADEKVYIDPEFFAVLAGPRFGAAGDFAEAYVVAHELGHHVQNLTGVSEQVRARQRSAASPAEANAWGIRLELQADCLAGTWANLASSRPATFEGNDNLLYLEPGDLEEGLRAAAAVGDNRIQESAGQDVEPHTWNHGSDVQREAWFTLGIDTGDPTRCGETFDESVPATEIMPR